MDKMACPVAVILSSRTLVFNGSVHRVRRMTSVGSSRSSSTSEGIAVTFSAVPSSVHSRVLLGSQLGLKETQACSLRVSPCHPVVPTLQALLGLALTHQPNQVSYPHPSPPSHAAHTSRRQVVQQPPSLVAPGSHSPRCSSGITACAPAQANHVSQLYPVLVTMEVEDPLSLESKLNTEYVKD